MRDYIWRYPRGSYIQERWFDLGNPGLDLLWHLVSPVDDLFIGPTSVIDHLTLIESIVEKGADGAFSEGPTITGGVALGVQLLGQGPEGMLS